MKKTIDVYVIGDDQLKILHPNGKVEFYNQFTKKWLHSYHSRGTAEAARLSLLSISCEYLGSL